MSSIRPSIKSRSLVRRMGWKGILIPIAFGIPIKLGIERLPERLFLKMVFGGITGCALGYVLDLYAERQGIYRLGDRALLGCGLAGALGGLFFALPMAGLFFILIRREARAQKEEKSQNAA